METHLKIKEKVLKGTNISLCPSLKGKGGCRVCEWEEEINGSV